MRRIRIPWRAFIISALAMAGLPACESQEQRRRIEALTRQVDQLRQENDTLKQQVEILTKENQDLKAQLEAATKEPAPAKK
jgi:cell division protein FtsB